MTDISKDYRCKLLCGQTTFNIRKGHSKLRCRSLLGTSQSISSKPKKHETGAGQAPYMFKTDSNGNGSYAAPLKESPYGKWQMLMIVLHPNGNPKDMKNMVGALSAKL